MVVVLGVAGYILVMVVLVEVVVFIYLFVHLFIHSFHPYLIEEVQRVVLVVSYRFFLIFFFYVPVSTFSSSHLISLATSSCREHAYVSNLCLGVNIFIHIFSMYRNIIKQFDTVSPLPDHKEVSSIIVVILVINK